MQQKSRDQQDERDTCAAFHEAVGASYSGVQLSKIAEKSFRSYFIEGKLARRSSTASVVRLLERLQAFKRKEAHRAWHAPWQQGTFVFLPGNENSSGPMIPFISALEELEVPVTLIVPRKAREWGSWSRQISKFSPIIHPDQPLFLRPEEREAVRAFTQQLKSFCSVFFSSTHSSREIARLTSAIQASISEQLSLLALIRQWIRRSRPAAFVADRPKGVLPLSYLLAGYLEGVPNVFMPHIAMRSLDEFRPAFFDLSLFSVAVVFSHVCRDVVSSLNPSIHTVVSGWPNDPPRGKRNRGQDRLGRFPAGLPAGYDYDYVKEVAAAAAATGVKLLIKGRPPGGDQRMLDEALSGSPASTTVALAHDHITLGEFLDRIDILICGRSNVGFHAAARSIPVVSFMSEQEKQAIKGLGSGVEVSDIAIDSCNSEASLRGHLQILGSLNAAQMSELCELQKSKFATIFPPYHLSSSAAELVSSVRSSSERLNSPMRAQLGQDKI